MNRSQYFKAYTNFIQCAVRLNEKSRKHELSSLENEIFDLDDEDFKLGLRLIVDEVDAAIIEEIYSNKISFEKDKYVRQFKTIQKRAVLGIQKQENTRILYYVLNSYANLSKDEEHKIDCIIMSDDEEATQ